MYWIFSDKHRSYQILGIVRTQNSSSYTLNWKCSGQSYKWGPYFQVHWCILLHLSLTSDIGDHLPLERYPSSGCWDTTCIDFPLSGHAFSISSDTPRLLTSVPRVLQLHPSELFPSFSPLTLPVTLSSKAYAPPMCWQHPGIYLQT